ncbi:hypothetical protein EYC84_011368 [Monilinia fructicola]|uniref:Uncharacterized protein n=1 Tax=Monilinia fructicola TaxID=38448 RepID=A0A5M9J5V3_MONFR|nr:hypothetical protein EYC84_011368 [Monilinia fructicola]
MSGSTFTNADADLEGRAKIQLLITEYLYNKPGFWCLELLELPRVIVTVTVTVTVTVIVILEVYWVFRDKDSKEVEATWNTVTSYLKTFVRKCSMHGLCQCIC